MAKYTVGLKQVKVGDAVAAGTIDATAIAALTKQFKVYNDTCEVTQDAPSKTEHKEENNAIPVVVLTERNTPRVKFQVMETDADALKLLMGGINVADLDSGQTGYGFDGTDDVPNKCFQFETAQGMDIFIPNGSISATLTGKLSKTGILLVDVEITPEAVTASGARPFTMIPKAN